MRVFSHYGLVLFCGILSGCHDQFEVLPTHPVSGKVMFKGQPLANAEIWLVPTTDKVLNAKTIIRPYAKSGKDGTFTITSYIKDDGAPAGDYGVIVQKVSSQGPTDDVESNEENAVKTKAPKGAALPTKYRTATTSGLTFTVKDGPNQLDLDLN
jgi:hypothetical protein